MTFLHREEPMPVTSDDILDALRLLRQHDEILVPNVHAPWECDMLTITRAGYVHEFEIKISRADFHADFKKEKHQHYAARIPAFLSPWYGEKRMTEIPGRFWFVTMEGIATADDIPEYAGWIEARSNRRYPKVIKQAPQLHKVKATQEYRIRVLQSMMHRYWQARYKLKRKGLTP
jgi:hypothetical protein